MARRKATPKLPAVLDRLEELYGPPRRPAPRKALDWILWENAAYLVPDERRAEAYAALKKATGLTAAGILGLSRERLRELADLGGMIPARRVEKLLAIAETVQETFDGDLEAALELPLPQARRALKKFPGIGDPGADKILLFTGTHDLPALDSNVLRVLQRLGLAREGKSYSASYRTGCEVLAAQAARLDPRGDWLRRAHDLLRTHGKELCKNSAPHCDACPLEDACPSAE